MRERVLAEIEPLRKDKKIGSSLQAKVVLTAHAASSTFLRRYARQLPMLFIVSEVELRPTRGRAVPRNCPSASSVPAASNASAAGATCRRFARAGVRRSLRAAARTRWAMPHRWLSAASGRRRRWHAASRSGCRLVVVALDQAAKRWCGGPPLHDSVTIIPGLPGLHARAQYRRGVRLSERGRLSVQDDVLSRSSPSAPWLASALYAAACRTSSCWRAWGLALIVGGAAGNLIDRV